MKRSKKLRRGPDRMRQLGKRIVGVWFLPNEVKLIDQARGTMTKRAAFVRAAALAAARSFLSRNPGVDKPRRPKYIRPRPGKVKRVPSVG